MVQKISLETPPLVPDVAKEYSGMIADAEANFASLAGKPFADDPRIKAGWEARREHAKVLAAQYLLRQVGNVPSADLHAAVGSEDLRTVLLRGGATFDKLMQVGEGSGDLAVRVAARQEELSALEADVGSFTDTLQTILGRVWKKVLAAEAKLKPFEGLKAWSKTEAAQYLALTAQFQESVDDLRRVIAEYRKKAARG